MVGVEFALIAEAGALEPQARRLVESVRQFAGALSDAAVTVASPRADRRPTPRTLAALAALGCEYVPLTVKSDCPSYGPSLRVHTMAALEQRAGPPVLVQLDSDTLFLSEVDLLPGGAQVAARPVDVRGMTTINHEDANAPYWRALCDLGGIAVEDLPWVTTTVDGVRVRASYNAGFVAAQRSLGLFSKTDELFRRSVAAGLRPNAGRHVDVRAGTGQVGPDGSEWWGSSQAALSVAATALGIEVAPLAEGVNIPLHYWYEGVDHPHDLAHVHYHYLFEREFWDRNPLLNGDAALSPMIATWLRASASLTTAHG